MHELTLLLSNPYIVLAVMIFIIMIVCMVYVYVSDKKDAACKKEHMYFDVEVAKWYYKSNIK
jgi:hypothetical protein